MLGVALLSLLFTPITSPCQSDLVQTLGVGK